MQNLLVYKLFYNMPKN